MRILAVDPGEKNIGIAVSDPTGTIANPVTVVQHVARALDAAQIASLAAEYGAGKVIVGQALDSDGQPTPEGRRALNSLFAHTGRAFLIGVTGSPGAGKSSLVGRLAKALRGAGGAQDPRVGIIAIDPTSPFSGGALLGDRVRMRELAGDPGIFIRSMASRGALGGLARATEAVVQAMDAAGYGVILIETVGAGQSEVDIARLAHTVVVVEAPGLGDDIQAIKAGILEIADTFHGRRMESSLPAARAGGIAGTFPASA